LVKIVDFAGCFQWPAGQVAISACTTPFITAGQLASTCAVWARGAGHLRESYDSALAKKAVG